MLIKKAVSAFLILSIIWTLFSCKKEDTKTVKKPSGEILFFEANVSFNYADAESEATVRHLGFEMTQFTFSKPNSISGMVITKTDSSFTMELNGMSQSVSESRPYNDSPAILLSEILEAVQRGEGKTHKKKGETNYIAGKIREHGFKVFRDSENNITEISCEGLSFNAVFSNYKSLEAEIGADPVNPPEPNT